MRILVGFGRTTTAIRGARECRDTALNLANITHATNGPARFLEALQERRETHLSFRIVAALSRRLR